MHSSTSSSDAQVPVVGAATTLVVALFALIVGVGLAEYAMARRGYLPTAIDSEELWRRQRTLAAEQADAVVILGSSRGQIGIDLAITTAATGRRAFQLAIDNNSFVPILAGLAREPGFAGLVVVDYSERYLEPGKFDVIARAYERGYWRHRDLRTYSPSQASEAILADGVRSRLRIYADGAQPFTNLVMRVINPSVSPQYLVTLPNRSQDADFSRMDLPQFYYRTTARYLDLPIASLPWAQGLPAVEAHLEQAIAAKPAPNREAILKSIDEVTAHARAIEARGGRVLFVRMPSCGMVLELEEHLYPRRDYWELLAAANPGRTLHFRDDAELATTPCPDGSHIDRKDVAAFSTRLWQRLQALAPAGQ